MKITDFPPKFGALFSSNRYRGLTIGCPSKVSLLPHDASGGCHPIGVSPMVVYPLNPQWGLDLIPCREFFGLLVSSRTFINIFFIQYGCQLICNVFSPYISCFIGNTSLPNLAAQTLSTIEVSSYYSS